MYRSVPSRPAPEVSISPSTEPMIIKHVETPGQRVRQISGNGMYVKKRMARNPEYSDVMIRGLSDQGLNPIEKNSRYF